MYTLDEKGKFFTDRVSTQRIEVLVLTIKGEVRGYVHSAPGQRIKDLLNNRDEQFVALTDVTISGYDLGARQSHFVALNKDHIISVIPAQEPGEAEGDRE